MSRGLSGTRQRGSVAGTAAEHGCRPASTHFNERIRSAMKTVAAGPQAKYSAPPGTLVKAACPAGSPPFPPRRPRRPAAQLPPPLAAPSASPSPAPWPEACRGRSGGAVRGAESVGNGERAAGRRGAGTTHARPLRSLVQRHHRAIQPLPRLLQPLALALLRLQSKPGSLGGSGAPSRVEHHTTARAADATPNPPTSTPHNPIHWQAAPPRTCLSAESKPSNSSKNPRTSSRPDSSLLRCEAYSPTDLRQVLVHRRGIEASRHSCSLKWFNFVQAWRQYTAEFSEHKTMRPGPPATAPDVVPQPRKHAAAQQLPRSRRVLHCNSSMQRRQRAELTRRGSFPLLPPDVAGAATLPHATACCQLQLRAPCQPAKRNTGNSRMTRPTRTSCPLASSSGAMYVSMRSSFFFFTYLLSPALTASLSCKHGEDGGRGPAAAALVGAGVAVVEADS